MASQASQVALAFGVGFFNNKESKIPEQLKLLEVARRSNIRMLDTSRSYACDVFHWVIYCS